MSTLSSANVTDVNLVLKERTHTCLCLNMLIFMHNLGNWLIRYGIYCNITRMFTATQSLIATKFKTPVLLPIKY